MYLQHNYVVLKVRKNISKLTLNSFCILSFAKLVHTCPQASYLKFLTCPDSNGTSGTSQAQYFHSPVYRHTYKFISIDLT